MALFYTAAGAMALITVLLLIRPLLAGRGSGVPRGARDAQLYRDQLDEVERDLERGTISATEAEGARADVSRRLIGAVERAEAAASSGPAPRRYSRLLAGISLIGAPALAALMYLSNGMPDQPGLPIAERAAGGDIVAGQQGRPSQAEAEATFAPGPAAPLSAEQQEYTALMTRLEGLLEQQPNDPKGLELLASGYMRLGRYGDSWRTYEKLVAITGDPAEAELHASMAEAMVLAAGGYVSPEAERALEAALERDPELPMARYYAGLLMAQNGQVDAAIATWQSLKAEAPEDAAWLAFLNGVLDEAMAMRDGAPTGLSGPNATDIEAAGALSPAERQEMIESMVARLEERLTGTGGEVEEWLRLMNAYAQLGRPEDATRIARLGIATFGNSTEADFLKEQALLMGLLE